MMLAECTECGEVVSSKNITGFCWICAQDHTPKAIRRAERRNRIVGMIWQAASRSHVCPSNADFAADLGDISDTTVSRMINDLARDGVLSIEGSGATRVVTLRASGVSTAAPWVPCYDTLPAGPLTDMLLSISELFEIEPGLLVSKSRSGWVMPARFGFCLVANERGYTTGTIGRYLGGRDHSTVCHAIDRAKWIRDRDPEYAAKLAQVKGEQRQRKQVSA